MHGPNRISSDALGYDLQYWIYLPENAAKPLPELYVTDGQAYLRAGGFVDRLDDEHDDGNLLPFAVIFVDSSDPDFPEETRRNKEFMCNVQYAKFYVGELMPTISRLWTEAGPGTRRGIMGASFGAINSACFGMMLPGVFQLLIMQSPGSDAHLDVIDKLYRERPKNRSGFFISHGGEDDNEEAARRFVKTLENRGYPVRHVATDGGHGWADWRPLIDDSLRAFSAQLEGQANSLPAPTPGPDDAGSDGQ